LNVLLAEILNFASAIIRFEVGSAPYVRGSHNAHLTSNIGGLCPLRTNVDLQFFFPTKSSAEEQGMADAFALLRTGTSFDRKERIEKRAIQKTNATEIPRELDFFGDIPADQNVDTPTEQPPKKRKREESSKEEEKNEVRKKFKIHVTGTNSPGPLSSFGDLSEFGAPEYLISNIEEFEYKVPTPVQMQAIPIILKKRDLLACAPTGSGKTLAYLIPLLVQLKSHQSKGFRAVIITPTRELAQQVSPSMF
jgi:ATP-dependent RNA helicase DDX52/ROK1